MAMMSLMMFGVVSTVASLACSERLLLLIARSYRIPSPCLLSAAGSSVVPCLRTLPGASPVDRLASPFVRAGCGFLASAAHMPPLRVNMVFLWIAEKHVFSTFVRARRMAYLLSSKQKAPRPCGTCEARGRDGRLRAPGRETES